MLFVPGTNDRKYNRGERYIGLAFCHRVFQISVIFLVILSVPQTYKGQINAITHVKSFYEMQLLVLR